MKTFRFAVPVTFRFSVEADTRETAQKMARSVVAQLFRDVHYFSQESYYPAVGALDAAVIHTSDADELDEGEAQP